MFISCLSDVSRVAPRVVAFSIPSAERNSPDRFVAASILNRDFRLTAPVVARAGIFASNLAASWRLDREFCAAANDEKSAPKKSGEVDRPGMPQAPVRDPDGSLNPRKGDVDPGASWGGKGGDPGLGGGSGNSGLF